MNNKIIKLKKAAKQNKPIDTNYKILMDNAFKNVTKEAKLVFGHYSRFYDLIQDVTKFKVDEVVKLAAYTKKSPTQVFKIISEEISLKSTNEIHSKNSKK